MTSDKVKMTIEVDKELANEIKHKAIDKNMKIRELIIEAVKSFLGK